MMEKMIGPVAAKQTGMQKNVEKSRWSTKLCCNKQREERDRKGERLRCDKSKLAPSHL